MIGVVARASDNLDTIVGADLDAFTALSREHTDGWGTAAWRGDQLDVETVPIASHLSESFARAMAGTVTDAAIVHIRLAGSDSPLILQDVHPFHAPTLAFAHNGRFSPARALDDLLDPPLLAAARGDSESERFFLLVRQLMRDTDPGRALFSAATCTRRRAFYSGLSCLLLTADSLYAYSEQDPNAGVSSDRGPDCFSLSYLVRDDRVIVASTDWDQQAARWQRLPERQVLRIRRHDLVVQHYDLPEGYCAPAF